MRALSSLLVLVLVLALGMVASNANEPQWGTNVPTCTPAGSLARLPELPEASGLALSRRVPGLLWSHNDSGRPILFALDVHGAIKGRVLLEGVTIDDWEAVAVGPCPAGSCLYVADIGDNRRSRKQITIYRAGEPSETDTSIAMSDFFHATYPDGPHNAETLLVMPDGALFIVTKDEARKTGLYRFPQVLRPGTTHRLERVDPPRGGGTSRAPARVTDGAVSPDGQWTVLRSNEALMFYRTSELRAGRWDEVGNVPLKTLREPQGEGVAIAADGTIFLAGEGGRLSGAGTLARLACKSER